MRAAYRVKRYTAGGVIDTPHATHGEAWAAYEAARVESQGGVGLPPRYRVELWRVRGGKLIAYTKAKHRATRRDIDEALMALNITAGLSHERAASAPHDGQGWIIGSYYVLGAYGGWQLVQVMGDTGGVRSITQGYDTAGRILEAIHTYRGGMAAGRLSARVAS